MELFIETLTGTSFELRVSPFETIMSVKAKIQRLEGIPIAQQHLIWNSVELDDDYCLHDYSIHDGATLKLVLAMRGGPINTRRIPMEDPALREMAEYMEANRDEILDKLPGNQQVTLLVFREGDQLNFFRVVDRGDGTLTPLSESVSAASMYNLCDDDDDTDVASGPKEKVVENDKTKEKMKVLRMKMDDLTLKKPKRKFHLVRPPSGGRPGSKNRIRRVPSASKIHNHSYSHAHNFTAAHAALSSLNKSNPLSPVGGKQSRIDIGSSELLLSDKSHTPRTVPKSNAQPNSAGQRQAGPIDSAKLKHTLTSVKEDIDLKARGHSETVPKPASNSRDEMDSLEALMRRANLSASSSRPDPSLSFSQDVSHSNTRSSVIKDGPKPPTSPRKKPDLVSLDSIKDTLSMSRPKTSSRGLERILDSPCQEATGPGRPGTSRREVTLEALKESLGCPTTSSKYTSLDRKQNFMLDSLGPTESRAKSGLLRQISIERLGSSKITNFVGSASKNHGSLTKDGRIPTPEGRMVSGHLQRLSASREGRVMSPSHRLPPVRQKKKAGKRCFICAKKTGLATSYQCRCGNNFCATHRYAEAHDCTFDYKSEGRKLLEQSNPVVNAPKLPKI